MFSLCIPTMNRYDNFLSKNIPKYLNNSLIEEIIISYENGEDYEKIRNSFNNPKLKLFKNDNVLGPFLNKLQACKKAKNSWIALIDSDNFADEDYFIKIKKYIDSNNVKQNSIIHPDYGIPIFNFKKLSGLTLNKNTLSTIKVIDMKNSNNLDHLLNIGNYVLNKYLIDNLKLDDEYGNIKKTSACDVVYINTLFMEQLDVNIHIIDSSYYHTIHDDNSGIYVQTRNNFPEFNNETYQRFYNLME
jgi:hypothetical protein